MTRTSVGPIKKYIGSMIDDKKRYKYARALDNPNDKKAQNALAYFRAKSYYQTCKDKNKKDK